jgi:hypothetical protein
MKKVILSVIFIAGTQLVEAQDVTLETQRKNTVKLDLTSYYLYRNAISLSYERITKPNQSFALTAGYQEFPRTSSLGGNIGVKEDKDKNGFKFGGEYRFYLKKENKHLAPRGIYIGPYLAYHAFNNERVIEVDNDGTLEQAILDSKFTIFNVGFQLGYQFMFNNRWTVDLVLIGPSISNYRYNLKLRGNYTFDKEDIQNEIILALIDKFPVLDDIITDKEASGSGKLDAWAYGYRYQLLVGYHFGRKKK